MTRYVKYILVCCTGAALGAATIAGCLYFSYHATIQNRHHSQGKNALWARHQWVGEPHSPAEYAQLITLLQQHGISDVFFHVGPLNAQGRIEAHKYPFASDLLRRLKQSYPQLHIQAWIGQVEVRGGGPLDLSNPIVQKNILHTAEIFLELGFDGIHYNIEPIYSDDTRLLELLQQTKKITQSRQKLLSFSCDEPELLPGMSYLSRFISKQAGFWTLDYYRQVAEHVDQLAVMMYDTALPTDWLYGHAVKWITQKLLTELPSETTLFMGVPSYEDTSWSFHPKAENISSGLRGIKQGLATFHNSKLQNFGVAVYAEWTTDADEWKTFAKEWLE